MRVVIQEQDVKFFDPCALVPNYIKDCDNVINCDNYFPASTQN